jgi:hypothetical protein
LVNAEENWKKIKRKEQKWYYFIFYIPYPIWPINSFLFSFPTFSGFIPFVFAFWPLA